MSVPITVKTLFENHRLKLSLRWIAGQGGETRSIKVDNTQTDDVDVAGVSLAGHLNLIHLHRIQVLGKPELEYLKGLNKNSFDDAIEQLVASKPACIIIANDGNSPDELRKACDRTITPLLSSPFPSQLLVNHLQYYLSNLLADHITLHGTFMEVMGIGVLITGESGVGKSELALELITRGHRLIADDAPEFSLAAPDTISGTCPLALRDFIEVRGLGVLNIRTMFGDGAIKNTKYLRLIIHLERMPHEKIGQIDRLRGNRNTRSILDVEVPVFTLPIAPGRNLAVLVEAAVRNHILSLNGYNAAQDFITIQENLIQQDTD